MVTVSGDIAEMKERSVSRSQAGRTVKSNLKPAYGGKRDMAESETWRKALKSAVDSAGKNR